MTLLYLFFGRMRESSFMTAMWGYQINTGLVLLLFFWSLAEAGKLLVVPQDGSHWLSTRVVVDKLWERGHNIVAVIPEASLLMKSSENFIIKTYTVPYTQESLDRYYHSIGKDCFFSPLLLEKITITLKNVSEMTTMFSSTCRHLLYDEELMKYLQDSNFDAIMMDAVWPCGPIIAEFLSFPSVYFMRGLPCGLNYRAAQCPNPFSYGSRLFTSSSDYMTFTECVKNLLVGFSEHILCYLYSKV
nr:PREDICTED: UDP-glucuronosyltransferase 1-1-like [Struthio camelus australis]